MALWLLRGGRTPDLVQWIIRHDFLAVSLHSLHADLDPVEKNDAAAAIKQAGLVVNYHPNFGKTLDPDAVARVCDDVLWWQANAGGVRACLADPIPVDWAACVALVQELSRRLAPHGIRSGLENSFGPTSVYKLVADVARLKQECVTPLLAHLLDTGHANIEHHGRVGDFVRSLPLEIGEVHLTDNHGEKDEHRALGAGNVDWPELFAALRERNYTGPLTVEVCVDILRGQYAQDIRNPQEMDPVLRSRDQILAAW
jgi:sugar phosphate isomerase/epimerase